MYPLTVKFQEFILIKRIDKTDDDNANVRIKKE